MLERLYEVPALVWSNINAYRENYGKVAGVLGAACLIQRQWGFMASAGFITGVAINYPLIVGHIKVISHIDLNSIVQAVIAVSLPVLFFYYPSTASLYIPMVCSALALSILWQMWEKAKIAEKLSQENKRLAELNVQLETLSVSFNATAEKLEEQVKRYFASLVNVEGIVQEHDQLMDAVNLLDQSANKRIEGVIAKIGALTSLQEKTQSSPVKAESRLTELHGQCAAQTAKAACLNGELEALKDQLKGVIDELSKEKE